MGMAELVTPLSFAQRQDAVSIVNKMKPSSESAEAYMGHLHFAVATRRYHRQSELISQEHKHMLYVGSFCIIEIYPFGCAADFCEGWRAGRGAIRSQSVMKSQSHTFEIERPIIITVKSSLHQ